jgi:hypothetical protein
MAREKTLRLQLLGALILLGRFSLESVQTIGFCMCGLRSPVADSPRPALPGLTLTPAEQLTWSGLQWCLGRQERRSRSLDQDLTP